jgi:subtilisin-like proprotein convertase family protein
MACAAVQGLPESPVPSPSYGDLPLHFEPMPGPGFVARGTAHVLQLEPDEAVLTLCAESGRNCALHLQWAGGNSQAALDGERLLPGRSHYLRGRDVTRWRTGVPHFSSVRYTGVYPGVDLLFYGEPRRLEYDFIVEPGADPSGIRLAFTLEAPSPGGTASIVPALEPNGDLVFATPSGEVRLLSPRAYQESPDGLRQQVAASFLLGSRGDVAFRTGPYDSTRPLVIDPVLVYGTYLGGSGLDYAYDIAVDTVGNSYVIGNTMSTDFPVSPIALQPENGGGEGVGDVFIAKLNPSGTSLVFCTYLGGSDNDGGVGIALDGERNVYVTGGTDSADFPVTPGSWQSEKAPGRDAFFSKLSGGGDALLYSTFLGGGASDCGVDLAIDGTGRAFVAGWTFSMDFPTTAGVSQPVFGGGHHDAFVCSLDAAGAGLLYSTYLGGAGQEDARSIALDTGGHAYVTGYTSSQDFPVTPAAFQPAYQGGDFDAFVTKLDPEGAALVYSTCLGGTEADSGRGIAVDAAGCAYVTGDTNSWNFPATLGSFQPMFSGGDRDAFVYKLNPEGAAPVYGTFLGGGSTDYGYAVAIDATGNAYLTGYTYSTDFPVIAGTLQPAYGGSQDAFVTKLNRFGSLLSFSTYLGGTLWEKGNGIGLDGARNLYVAGSTGSSNFPITVSSVQPLASGGGSCAFVVRMATDSDPEGEGEGSPDGAAEGEGQTEGAGLRVWLVGSPSRTLNAGSSVTFTVGISGYTGAVTYEWWFKPLDAADFSPIYAPNSPIFVRNNLRVSDSGKYRCSVTDQEGMALSPSFTLTVLGSEGEGGGDGEGIIEGEGTPEGGVEGTPEGEGGAEGLPEGEGFAEGQPEGTADGEGSIEGEGAADGEGAIEGEGSFDGEVPCNVEIFSGPLRIPLMDRGLTIANLAVPASGVIRDLNVTLGIEHPDLTQLLAQLISPQGMEVFLFLYPEQGGANLADTVFDDDAETVFADGAAPFAGNYAPVMPLQLFNGGNMHGTWALRLVDSQAGITGYLNGWGLSFNPCLPEGEGEGTDEGQPQPLFHTADTDSSGQFNLTELLRVIQFFNSGGYHCDPLGEDGFAPGSGDSSGPRHDSDYLEPPWRIDLTELLRLIQFYNIRGYHRCEGSEDGFCTGPAPPAA